MRKAQLASVVSLALLGLIGGCLILSQDGFTTSSKRGHWSIFVPEPEAYVMAAIMFVLSILASFWLLREIRARQITYVFGIAGYCGAVFMLTDYLATHIQ